MHRPADAITHKLIYTLALIYLALIFRAEAQFHNGIINSKSLKKAIYAELKHGAACVRLLHVNGTVGCAAPNKNTIEGVLVRIDASIQQPASYPDGSVFIVPPDLLDDFLLRSLEDSALRDKTKAVLVEAGEPANFSPASASPLAEYMLYPEKGYRWNPNGTGLSLESFPFPVFLLDNSTTASAQQRAQYNAKRGWEGALHVGRMRLQMEAAHNSSACLEAGTCLPLGGHSVAGAVPPLLNTTGAEGNLPLILVLASQDTTAFFHDKAQGANAPFSGLIAMLAAAQILGASAHTSAYTRHVVFTALAGETWGYMGSKRMLWEMAGGGSNATAGLSLDAVETVVEVQQVGRALDSSGGASLYLHHRKGHNNTLSIWQTMKAAAANTSEVPVSIERPSGATPGLPPSSANSFLRVGPDSIRAVVLEDFDTQFQTATFESIFDTADTINSSSIVAAALVLARSLHVLALGDTPPFPPLPINFTAVQQTVDSLMECLLGPSGYSCPLASALMTPLGGAAVQRYIGILRTLSEDPLSPDGKADLARFVWSYLAFVTAGVNPLDPLPAAIPRCQPYNLTACAADAVCAGYRSVAGEAGRGMCLPSTVRYIPSYSTSLVCEGCKGSATPRGRHWKVTQAANKWEREYGWPPDPLWTESNWPFSTPHLELLLREASGVDWGVMVAGSCLTAVAGVVALATHAAFEKRLKQS